MVRKSCFLLQLVLCFLLATIVLPPTSVAFAAGCPGTPPGSWLASADLDKNGSADLVIADTGNNVVQVYYAVSENVFADPLSIFVFQPRDVVVADLDGDSLADLAVYSASTSTVTIFLQDGSGAFKEKSVVALDGPTNGMATIDEDKDGASEIFLTIDEKTSYRISDAKSGFKLDKVTGGSAPAGDDALKRCGDEPDCKPSPEYEGIQECMRAADCRAEKCAWAACILYTDHWWQKPRYAAAMAACAAVHIVETTACIPSQFIPKISVK